MIGSKKRKFGDREKTEGEEADEIEKAMFPGHDDVENKDRNKE